MSNIKTDPIRVDRFDRPSENLIAKNTEHAPWHGDDYSANDKSQHRRHHSLFEDLMN